MATNTVFESKFENNGAGYAETAFRVEAAQYCEGISDRATRQYAERYAAALEQHFAVGSFAEPQKPGIFGPSKNLIRVAFKSLFEKHFNRRPRINRTHAIPSENLDPS